MNNYFEIENLKCSYNDGTKVVLEIAKLEIPRGKVVFIVGQSGCGKSTVLETLGLMNDTLVCENDTKFVFSPDGKNEIDCTKIWNRKNKWSSNNKELSKLREKNFSFIFQNTNLMEHFSIKENAEVSQQIKGGKKEYDDVMKEVELNQVLDENKEKVSELSGGQKQRLAFVRAFLPDFHILFGDEPTGNLDPDNADKLIEIIEKEVHPSSPVGEVAGGEEKTAIIVSHTPKLYYKYADIIITIHKRERDKKDKNGNIIKNKEGEIIKETYGLINEESVKYNYKNHKQSNKSKCRQ